MLNLNDLALFVTAVEQGGFAAGGRHLGLPRSTLSKRVALLEEQLQVRLLQRSSRRFALTEVGQEFFERARAALSEVEAAEAIVRDRQAEPSGTVRISASIPVVQGELAACLPVLARRYPRLRIEVEVSDRFIDLAQEGIDIALRSHFGPLPDSGLVQRMLGSERIVLVASPGYLAAAPALDTPEQLRAHAGLLTAREMLLEAAVLDAPTMLARGFLQTVLYNAEVPAEALQRAERMTRLAPLAARLNKQALRALAGGQGAEALLPTAYDYADSPEHREGIAAFLAKRPPHF